MTAFITLVSGKGGVGKTTATINIGQALLSLGQKVIILDGNMASPNIALHLGVINPKATLNQFLRKEKDIREILHQHASGLRFIPASPSYKEFQKTNSNLSEIFEHLDGLADFVLVDAPSGYHADVTSIVRHCQEALIIANPTLSSCVEALKTIEVVKQHNNITINVILNMTHNERHELKTAEIEALLDKPILSNIRADKKVRKSQHQQVPLNYRYPHSRIAKQFKDIAQYISMYRTV